MTKRDVIKMSLANAKDWKHKGQPIWVVRCLSTALANRIRVALTGAENKESTLNTLRSDGFINDLCWYCDELSSVAAEIGSKRLPPSSIGGNYLLIVFHHFARLLSMSEEERVLLETTISDSSMTISTRLWQEYARGLNSVSMGTPFKPRELGRLKGQESYWVPYLHLLAAVSSRDGIQQSSQLVDESFAKRNLDASISDDQYDIEGSGQLPLRWDYRKACLLSYMQE